MDRETLGRAKRRRRDREQFVTPDAGLGGGWIVGNLGDRHAVLLGNHGAIVTGADLTSAWRRAIELENLAHMYYLTIAVGRPAILSDDEVGRIVDRFRTYGAKDEEPAKRAPKKALKKAPKKALKAKAPAKVKAKAAPRRKKAVSGKKKAVSAAAT